MGINRPRSLNIFYSWAWGCGPSQTLECFRAALAVQPRSQAHPSGALSGRTGPMPQNP